MQFVMLWIFMWGIGLVFDAISAVWDSAISIPLGIFYSLKRRDSRFSERIKQMVNFVVPVLAPVPRILRVAVQIFIFVALFRPLFDQVSTTSGSSGRFHAVARSARAPRIGEAVGQVRNILFP
jgi:ABC-type phosphate transport system permease subunit